MTSIDEVAAVRRRAYPALPESVPSTRPTAASMTGSHDGADPPPAPDYGCVEWYIYDDERKRPAEHTSARR